MGVDLAHYHGWHGKRQSPWLGMLTLVRVAFLQLARRKMYWFIFALALLNFLTYFAVIYAVTQLNLPNKVQEEILDRLGIAPNPQSQGINGYVKFIDRQGLVVMVLLTFSGSLLIGSDFRDGTLPFYLSRGIERRHYIVGKLLAVSSVIWCVTVIPALVLFLEYGLFTSSTDFWWNNLNLLTGVLGYGTLLAVVLAVLLVTISAYLQRMAPIAIVWSCLFLLLALIAQTLRRTTGDEYWKLIDVWRNIKYVSLLFFNEFAEHPEQHLVGYQAAILATIVIVMVIALVRRVRAVEIVA